jgi:hypothetical protein
MPAMPARVFSGIFVSLLGLAARSVEAAEPAPADNQAAADESAPAPTESAPVPAESESATAEGAPAPAAQTKETSFAVVPGPFYNPSLGIGLNVIPMLMFHPSKSDDVSPASIAMLNLLYAVKPPFDEAGSRQSLAAVAMTRLFLDEDRWRVTGIAGYVNLFQQYFPAGASDPSFDYRLEQVIAIAQVFRQVGWKGFYVGALVGAIAYHTKTDNPEDEAILDGIGSSADWSVAPNLGLLSQYDSRDNKYYPTRGANFSLRINGSFKSEQEYVLLAPGFNQYFPLLGTDRLVLAYRVFGQFGFGDLPISAYARYGMRGTTLGYETGEYMDKKMAGLESEIRWLVWKRVGVEGGAGVGKVFAEFDDFTDAAWLPGVWGSGTYKIMEERDIRARATIAYGKSGALFYFAVGQNF